MTKKRKKDSRLLWWLTQEDLDPNSIKEAFSSVDNSLYKKDVSDIVELPKGHKSVGSKWIFKHKHDADGKVEQHKARLLAQGYTQKCEIEYKETFCPVVSFKSIKTIIALAAKHNLPINELDLMKAFPNGSLQDIFMKQPERFKIKGKVHMMCKLKRRIYGLKQSSRCWNQALDKYEENRIQITDKWSQHLYIDFRRRSILIGCLHWWYNSGG